jgi:hypothetical protein
MEHVELKGPIQCLVEWLNQFYDMDVYNQLKASVI